MQPAYALCVGTYNTDCRYSLPLKTSGKEEQQMEDQIISDVQAFEMNCGRILV